MESAKSKMYCVRHMLLAAGAAHLLHTILALLPLLAGRCLGLAHAKLRKPGQQSTEYATNIVASTIDATLERVFHQQLAALTLVRRYFGSNFFAAARLS
eukprot:6186107-Pleurochrysis_carterae.AAC.4